MEKHQDSVYHTGKAQLFYNKDQVFVDFSSDYKAEPEIKNEKVQTEENLSLSSALTLINNKSSSITEEFYQDDTVTSKLLNRKKSDAHDFIDVCNADLEANIIPSHDPDFCTYGCYECHEYNFERENEWTDAQPNAWDDWNKKDEPENESKVSQLVLEPTLENIYKRPRLWTYNDVPECSQKTIIASQISPAVSIFSFKDSNIYLEHFSDEEYERIIAGLEEDENDLFPDSPFDIEKYMTEKSVKKSFELESAIGEYDYATSTCKKLSKSRSVNVERKGQKLARALSDYMVSSLKLEDM